MEVVFRVVRAGRSFGMVLHGDDRQGAVAHSFDALVVEIDVSNFDLGRQTVSTNSEAVIVRRDLHAASRHFFHGLIPAAMAEDEFESLGAKRASQQLMSETDAEHRDARIQQLLDFSNFVVH